MGRVTDRRQRTDDPVSPPAVVEAVPAPTTATDDELRPAVELQRLHRVAESTATQALLATQARNRAVCDLYDADKWTHQRIADLLGVTVGRVGQIIRAGMRDQNNSGSPSSSSSSAE